MLRKWRLSPRNGCRGTTAKPWNGPFPSPIPRRLRMITHPPKTQFCNYAALPKGHKKGHAAPFCTKRYPPTPFDINQSVTAEAAGSSPVVPAIQSKAVSRISLKPSRAQKGRVSRHFCALFGDPQFPIQQREALLTYRKKKPATLPPPALHASRALLPACKRPK